MAEYMERLFTLWISAFAAFVFLIALILACFNVINWLSVAYVYGGISVVTLVLAALLYISRRKFRC